MMPCRAKMQATSSVILLAAKAHASPTTTNRYAKVDLEMKRQAIAKVKPVPRRSRTPWGKDRTILDWLESL